MCFSPHSPTHGGTLPAPAACQNTANEIEAPLVEVDSAQREADRLLLADYAPASVLVDEELNILQFRGGTGPYVEHASGPPSLNLHCVVRPELLVEISPAIAEARETGCAVQREGLSIEACQRSADKGGRPVQRRLNARSSTLLRGHRVFFKCGSR